MNTASSPQARATHRFATLPEQVFDAWLDPALIGRWMFNPGPRQEEVVRIALVARPGGAFSFVVRRQGQEIDHIGEYLEVDRPRRLVFTWGTPQDLPNLSQVVVEIVPLDDGCELTLTHELHPDWAAFADRAASWARMLDRLGATLSVG